MVDRLLAKTLADATKSFLVLGPRQTGKSTLIQSLAPDLEINLARESEFLTFSTNPGELEQRLDASAATTVFIDEVQRLPSLLNTVQALIDDAKRAGEARRFFLTGSSARKLRRGQANLLPGRLLTYSLGPLASVELEGGVDVGRALRFGTLPEPYLERDEHVAAKLLASYAGTYLKEEVQAEALARNLQGFSRFLSVAAASSGQLLDFSKLAQRARVSRTSTMRYFELLEDTLLASRIAPYPDAGGAELVKHPRYFFFDVGVWNGLLANFVASVDRIGSLFEHLVVSQLQATAAAYDAHQEIFTFRTRGGLDVDFIVRAAGVTWAIEAKATSNVTDRDAAGLVAARAYLPGEVRGVIVTPAGPSRRLASGIRVLGLADLLAEVHQ